MNMNKSNDNINHPKHYQGDTYECIEVLKDVLKDLKGFEAFCVGNVFKYIWRYKYKDGLKDLNKAKWYLNCAINDYDNNNITNNVTNSKELENIDKIIKSFGGKLECTKRIDEIKANNPFIGTPQETFEISYLISLLKSFICEEDEIFLEELKCALSYCDDKIKQYFVNLCYDELYKGDI